MTVLLVASRRTLLKLASLFIQQAGNSHITAVVRDQAWFGSDLLLLLILEVIVMTDNAITGRMSDSVALLCMPHLCPHVMAA